MRALRIAALLILTAGLALAGCCMHIFYRCKTKIWTCAWGGWNDLAAGRD